MNYNMTTVFTSEKRDAMMQGERGHITIYSSLHFGGHDRGCSAVCESTGGWGNITVSQRYGVGNGRPRVL